MRKVKVYLYPNRRGHVHDDNFRYVNTVPFSKRGITDWIESSGPDDAELFYMGQISDGTQGDFHKGDFEFFDKYPDRPVVDIEGDWLHCSVPDWLEPAILTINGCDQTVKNKITFVRPTFSTLLVNAAKRRFDVFEYPNVASFGFRGLPDPHGTRLKMREAVVSAGMPAEIIFNPQWNGPAPQGGQAHKDFESLMTRHLLSLCPRGCGRDSVRFYETCFFTRVPIIIGDGAILGEFDDTINTSFPYRISDTVTVDDMSRFLKEVYLTPSADLHHRAKQARHYFDNVVRYYFEDPTRAFLKFLNHKGIL